MSITSADDRVTTYNPVVATTEFAADFPIFNNSDITVFVNGVERADFTVTASYVDGISNDAKAVFTPGVTGIVQVVGDRSPRRTNRFVEGGALPIRDQNLALDTIEAEVQELSRDRDRAAKAPVGTRGPDIEIGAAGEIVAFNQVGNMIPVAPPSGTGNMAKELYDPRNIVADAYPFRTLAEAQAATVSPNVKVVHLEGRTTEGSGGFRAVEVTEDGSPLLPGQFQNGPVYLRRRWENSEDLITSAMFANPVEMFAFAKAELRIPAANYEFDAPMQTRANAVIRMEEGAIWRPTFELATALERATPYFRLAAGTSLDRLDVRLVTGINQVRTLIEANAKSRLGRVYLYSDDPNNNRVSEGALDAPYIENGAIVFKGEAIRVDHLIADHFDRGMACIGVTNLVIGYRELLRHGMGAYYEQSENIRVLGGRATGMSEADAATCSGRGRMTPGYNTNCFAGARGIHIFGEHSYGALEHANRVGLMAAGTTIPNDGIWYHGCTAEFSFGCGFKQDDGDAGLIRNIHYIQPVTIDIGAGVWGEANDGNKQGIAVRNSIRTVIEAHINRPLNTANSGYYGEWFERSDDVTSIAPDIEGARDAGILISNNGLDIESIQVRGGRLFGNGRGLAVVPGTNHIIRGLNISDLKASGNTGLDVDIQARPDGASGFVSTEKSRIEADAPKVSIAGAVYADADFSSHIFIGKARAVYNPPSLVNGASDTTTLTVAGAAVGDRVTVAFGDTQGVTMAASVTAADIVSVRFQNNTGAMVDIVQSAIIVQVYR
ncbi:hypothetical protein CN072_22325 [Sinorhizobium meliloti]|uniref:hypothetical protein n=1 Tax=Rhizobium meliloti TaxID=382 RepID=UPI000FD584FF|nr:hypothetical protein [Sinorhizobium meliloti]RVG92101.1 hypothetical protein CN218_18645 [Sinorhizobium meliloti]RVP82053.1 hypothetical protein CN072_22325 [Sinorhizobium meliloti]